MAFLQAEETGIERASKRREAWLRDMASSYDPVLGSRILAHRNGWNHWIPRWP